MKKSLLLLGLICTLFAFQSCEKNNEDITEQQQPVVNNTITQKLVFHYSRQDLTNNSRNGFIVDRHGNLKTYALTPAQSAQLPASSDWSESDVDFLIHNSGEAVYNINKDELYAHYLKIQETLAGKLVPSTDPAVSDFLIEYNTFTTYSQSVEAGTCSGCNADTYEEMMHKVRLLKVLGADNRINDSQAAADLIDWLDNLVLEAGL